jgi:hypothetical protein
MRRALVLAWSCCLGACGSESAAPKTNETPQGESGAGAGGEANPSSGAALHGGVVVTLHAPLDDGDGYTTAIGRFFSGPQPEILALEPRLEQDGCTLFVPRAPFCSNPCAPAVCTADDVCTDYPEPRDVGTLSLSGLGEALALSPASTMVVYQSPSLAYPPCEVGTSVTAAATGVSLRADCIAPLQLSGPDPIPVKSSEPVHLTWLAAARGAASRVRIKLDVSHHGGSKGEIDCEVPDSGAFDIPAPLVTELIGLGLAGFPTINLNRVVVGTDPAHPNLSLVLSSDATRAVDTGVVSCLDKSACPADQMCLDGGTCG